MSLIQRIHKGQKYVNSVQEGQKGGFCILILQNDYIHYIQTNPLEKNGRVGTVSDEYGGEMVFG